MELMKSMVLAAALLISIIYLSYIPDQSDFGAILICFFVSFTSYWFVLKSNWNLKNIVILAIVLRLLLLPSFPNLSDDIYRFIWDGLLLSKGMNPYLYLPSYLITDLGEWTPQANLLFDRLNSPHYYTIYPPISQLVFALSTTLSGGELVPATFVMKLLLLIGEIGLLFLLIKLLRYYKLDDKNIALYALNPLVIIEIMGNMHFEGLMLTFLCLAWLSLLNERFWQSAVAFSISIGIKLLPLMLLPFLIVYLGWKKAMKLFMSIGVSLLFIFIPIWLNFSFFWKSLDLYFQKFEFNASIYYLLRWLGFQIKGFNLIHIIGPFLAFSTIIVITILTINYKKRAVKNDLPIYWLLAFVSYLFLATTVHPWYTIVPIGLCIFTRFRFPILWSALIILSYANYSHHEYTEHLWFVAFEYMLVFAFLFYELMQHKRYALPSKIN